MAVDEIARDKVVSLGADETVRAAVRTMHDQSVGSVVVVEGDEPVGLVTDRAVAIEVLGRDNDPDSVTVGEIAEDVPTIDADAGLYDLVKLMSEDGSRRIPVVRDGELTGIISISDVVVLLGMELQYVANTIRSTSPAYERSATEIYD